MNLKDVKTEKASQMKRNSDIQQLLASNMWSIEKAWLQVTKNNYKYWSYSSQAISLYMKGKFLI